MKDKNIPERIDIIQISTETVHYLTPSTSSSLTMTTTTTTTITTTTPTSITNTTDTAVTTTTIIIIVVDEERCGGMSPVDGVDSQCVVNVLSHISGDWNDRLTVH
ncbi:hypothetical protein Ahia01_000503100 [Argonauta hians]